jgi:RNA polymerase sigma-70 factor (ECF subfamily)
LLVKDEKTCRTRDDVEASIRTFSVADWSRLHKVARAFAFNSGWTFEDLLQEAILRTLQGTRNCPGDVDVMKHLIESMSSISDGEREKSRRQATHLLIAQPGFEDAEDPPSPEWSAEDNLVYEGGKAEILAMFDDDPVARDLVEGILARFDTNQLKELTGLEGTAYNTKRTLVRRRLQKFSPRGRIA